MALVIRLICGEHRCDVHPRVVRSPDATLRYRTDGHYQIDTTYLQCPFGLDCTDTWLAIQRNADE